ncbi:MAG TPA: hypothetical protein VGK48_00735 [Terriglobia bacterium]|jgi:hypothetical protein
MSIERDDPPTLIAISALGYVLSNVLHEDFGHGVTAWLSGAHELTLSTVALQSDIETHWVKADGPLINLVFGALFWLVLRRAQRYSPATRFFLILAMAGNLFTGTGYFLFSGAFNFGDWADVIRDFQPHLIWQLGLLVLGAVTYFGAMVLVGAELKAFKGDESGRLRKLCWTAYFSQGVLALVAGLPNPAGLFYVIASALPSTLGANAGLLSLPAMMQSKEKALEPVGPIGRNRSWIVTGLVACLLFILFLGRGITVSR